MSARIKKFGFYAFLFYTLFGFFLLPFIVKSQLAALVQKQLNAQLSIENISFNPYIFTLQIDGITLSTLQDQKLLFLDSLFVDIEPHSLFRGALHLQTLRVSQPHIFLVLHADKSLNFASIIKNKGGEKEQPQEDSLLRIIVENFEVLEGSVAYEDYTRPNPFDFSFHNIGFSLKDVDTKDLTSSDARIRFYASLEDGGFIDFKSDILSLDPVKLEGSLDFQASKLYTQWRYIQDMLHLEVANGKLSLHTKYQLDLNTLEAMRLYDFGVSLESLRIKPKEEPQNIATLKNLSIQNGVIEPFSQRVNLDRVGLRGLDVTLRRDHQGIIDWLEYIKIDLPQQGDTNQTKEPGQTPPKAWDLAINEANFEKIKISFYDKGVDPQVDTTIDDLSIYAQNITLAGVEPLDYELSLRMNQKFHCFAKGSVVHKVLDAATSLECREFDIAHYRPYIDTAMRDMLRVYDLELASAWLDFDADVRLYQQETDLLVDVNNSNIKLSVFSLRKKSTQERLADFEHLSVFDIALSSKNKEISIGKTELASLDVELKRLKEKRFNFEDLVVFKQTQKKAKSRDENAYRVKLQHFALNDGRIAFLDQQGYLELDRIRLNAYDIDSLEKSWLRYDLALRTNKSGEVLTKGKLRHTPLKQSSALELNKISLKAFAPYIQEQSFIRLDGGSISMKSEIEYEASQTKPDLFVKGSFMLNDFFLSDVRNGSLLFSVIALELDSFSYEFAPDRLYINEMGIDSFYLNAIVDEQKNFNLASLMQKEQKGQKTELKEPFPATIAKITVANGSANFADLSLPIKFATNIHDLGGTLYSVSTTKEEASIVDISGEVDRYGMTRLKGSVDAADPKRYTDLQFVFKNLALSSMSGYSASFAGYKIDKGKLDLDLSYHIVNSQLQSSNNVIVDKIALGDAIEDENITKLPLGFVIALLEDKDGIIDLKLPIEGDIDQPEFKYGGLVFKTLTNLVIKAVSSPFEFLGSMMGIDGESLEYAEFEAGSADLLPPEKEKFDSIAKILQKRPKIALSIFGDYDSRVDAQALRYQKLVDLVVQKSGTTNIQEHRSALSIDLIEELYEELGGDTKKLQTIREKLDELYDAKAYKVEYLKALVNECSSLQTLTKGELEDLAQRRMERIYSYLHIEKGVAQEQLERAEVRETKRSEGDVVENKLGIKVKETASSLVL